LSSHDNFLIHKYSCCVTVQECFYCYTFICIYLFYSNIQSYLSQYFEYPPYFSLLTSLSCCTFSCSGYAITPQSYHGCFLSVLHSGHQIFLLSSSDIFFSTIISFLSHFVHLTLFSALLFLYFHASRQLLHHTFLSFSLETKSYSWFSSVLVPL